MAAISYTVIATLPDTSTLTEYVSWLQQGHVAAVMAGGATRGQIVKIEQPPDPLLVEVRYEFPDRQRFETYLQTDAPGLRADGLEKFPPERGVKFERRVGTVLEAER